MKIFKPVVIGIFIIGAILWYVDAEQAQRDRVGWFLLGGYGIYCAYLLLKDFERSQVRSIETQAAVSRMEERLETMHRQIGNIEISVSQIRERYQRPQPDFYDHVTRDRD